MKTVTASAVACRIRVRPARASAAASRIRIGNRCRIHPKVTWSSRFSDPANSPRPMKKTCRTTPATNAHARATNA